MGDDRDERGSRVGARVDGYERLDFQVKGVIFLWVFLDRVEWCLKVGMEPSCGGDRVWLLVEVQVLDALEDLREIALLVWAK